MATQVSVLDKNGTVTFYSTYAAARSAAGNGTSDHNLIQIWSNLNEQIILKDKVDIWIAEGVVLNNLGVSLTSSFITVTDDGVECHCSIFGNGIIKATFQGTGGTPVYECIKTTHPNTELSVECDHIEGVGGTTNDTNKIQHPSIHISSGKKISLKCNKIYNHRTCAIYLGLNSTFSNPTNIIEEITIDVKKIEIGNSSESLSQSIAIASSANGFIDVDEVVCRHWGHCFLQMRGDITAKIRKLSTYTNNNGDRDPVVTINHGGSYSPKLIL